mmetsp:Transcript_1820/g.7941  ORF Transcript_1820/g.7941 Transcript_1820/m.7941 type:complete len:370 (+) Transcript_1820:2736-3845(+)
MHSLFSLSPTPSSHLFAHARNLHPTESKKVAPLRRKNLPARDLPEPSGRPLSPRAPSHSRKCAAFSAGGMKREKETRDCNVRQPPRHGMNLGSSLLLSLSNNTCCLLQVREKLLLILLYSFEEHVGSKILSASLGAPRKAMRGVKPGKRKGWFRALAWPLAMVAPARAAEAPRGDMPHVNPSSFANDHCMHAADVLEAHVVQTGSQHGHARRGSQLDRVVGGREPGLQFFITPQHPVHGIVCQGMVKTFHHGVLGLLNAFRIALPNTKKSDGARPAPASDCCMVRSFHGVQLRAPVGPQLRGGDERKSIVGEPGAMAQVQDGATSDEHLARRAIPRGRAAGSCRRSGRYLDAIHRQRRATTHHDRGLGT